MAITSGLFLQMYMCIQRKCEDIIFIGTHIIHILYNTNLFALYIFYL